MATKYKEYFDLLLMMNPMKVKGKRMTKMSPLTNVENEEVELNREEIYWGH